MHLHSNLSAIRSSLHCPEIFRAVNPPPRKIKCSAPHPPRTSVCSRPVCLLQGGILCFVAVPEFLSLGMSLHLSDVAASLVQGVRRSGNTTVAIVRTNENRSEPVYRVAQNSVNGEDAHILNALYSTVCRSDSKCIVCLDCIAGIS